ncbi:MAG: DUF3108 domain-containing protein [Bacteroidota bacterium]
MNIGKLRPSLLLPTFILFSLAFTLPSDVDYTAWLAERPAQSISFDGEEACRSDNSAFEAGEEVVYKLYYNWNFIWLPAGEVVFQVRELEKEYHISAKGRTYTSYEWFFKVRDHYEVYVDKNTLLPSVSIRNVHEGGYHLYDKITYDQDNYKTHSLRGKTKEKAVLRSFDVDNCMHDILSIIYYVRNIDFDTYEAGQRFPVKIFMDKEVWSLQVKYEGKDGRKKIKGKGRFETIKLSPELIVGGIFKEDAKMNVWVSDDANRMPILIESPVSVGSVKAVLKSYHGLRHDLSSKIK